MASDSGVSDSGSEGGLLEEVAIADIKALQRDTGQQVIRERIRDAAELKRALAQLQLVANMDFAESLNVTHASSIDVAGPKAKQSLVDDDLKREERFAAVALAAVEQGLKQLRAGSVPFRRPDDYMAEMVKTDKHMSRVKDKLVFQKEKVDAAETRRKQRTSKKESRKIQVEKEQERRRSAKAQTFAVETLRKDRLKARARGEDPDDGKDFPVDLLDLEELEDGKFIPHSKQPGSKQRQTNRKREDKDKKFGFGGRKKGAKRNDAKSTSQMADFSVRRNKEPPAGMRGGIKKRSANKKRPGKSRRQNAR